MANTEAAEYWAARAPSWLDDEERIEEIVAAPGLEAMGRLELRPGHRVVDLGCGSARTTVELARRVAPGHAVGVDISESMLDRGREHAKEAGIDTVELTCGDVQVHHFGSEPFDRAYSRFGVMFFADPVAAFANVRRALRPDGRLSFVCWQTVFDNEWMLVPGAAVASVVGKLPPMAGADEPGPFALADPDRIRTVLTEAGFRRIDVSPRNDHVTVAEDRIPEVAQMTFRTGAVAELVKEVDADTRSRALTSVEEAMRSRVESGELRITRGYHVVVAEPGRSDRRRPGSGTGGDGSQVVE